MKISFIMSVYNEERIIKNALDNFKKINSFKRDIEFIIGLDGCTDKTLDIIKEYKFVRYTNFKNRNGKHFIIKELIKKAKGDIIIIQDADWTFNVNTKHDIDTILLWFKDQNLGGIAESYPVEYDLKRLNNIKSLGFLGSAWANYFWMDFQRKRFTVKKKNKLYVNPKIRNFPFLVNIFRKNLYIKNITLGDDFERSLDILNKGYSIIVLEDPNMPRMIASYDTIRIKDLFRQKLRTSIARDQIFKKYNIKVTLLNFYIPLFFYTLINCYKIKRIRSIFALFIWLFIMLITIIFKSKEKSTKDGWLMRAKH